MCAFVISVTHWSLCISYYILLYCDTQGAICDRVCENRHKIHLFIVSYLSLFLCGLYNICEFLRKFYVYDEILDKVLYVRKK